MVTILTPRGWQQQFDRGMLKRHSTAAKPVVWFLQHIKLRQFKHEQAERDVRRFAVETLS